MVLVLAGPGGVFVGVVGIDFRILIAVVVLSNFKENLKL
jgi:hypothetical protein